MFISSLNMYIIKATHTYTVAALDHQRPAYCAYLGLSSPVHWPHGTHPPKQDVNIRPSDPNLVHGKMKCCMHMVKDAKSTITQCSLISWEKFKVCAKQWHNLNTAESALAEKAISTFNINNKDVPVPTNVGYHRECYMRFTNKDHIERAQKRKEKANEGLYNMHYTSLPFKLY